MMDVEKLAEELVQLNVVQLNQLMQILQEKYGINMNAGVVVAPSAGGPPEATGDSGQQEKATVDVVIAGISPTASKLKIIQVVKRILNVDLKVAKEYVDKVPSVIKKGVSKDEAEAISKELSELGCTIELK